jgi:hypothetical protein
MTLSPFWVRSQMVINRCREAHGLLCAATN